MQVGMHITQCQPVWVLWLLCCDRLHKHKHAAPVHPYWGQHALFGWIFIWFEWNQFDSMQGHSCRAHPETTAKAPQMHSLDMADYLGPVLGDVYKEANLKQLYPWQVWWSRIAKAFMYLFLKFKHLALVTQAKAYMSLHLWMTLLLHSLIAMKRLSYTDLLAGVDNNEWSMNEVTISQHKSSKKICHLCLMVSKVYSQMILSCSGLDVKSWTQCVHLGIHLQLIDANTTVQVRENITACL